MSTQNHPLNLSQEGFSYCTPFRLKTNTSSVYLNLASNSQLPVEVKIVGQTGGSFVNYTYKTESFLLFPGQKYFLYNSSPPNTNVRLEFIGNSSIDGVWSPDSAPESGCITIGPEFKQEPNTTDEAISFTSTGNNFIFETNSRNKNTNSSVYLNLQGSSFSGTIDVSIYGVDDNEQCNCTNRCSSFKLTSGRKYELYNTVKENRFSQAKIRFHLPPNVTLKGLWSPDYKPEKDVITVRGGPSGPSQGNTRDTNFNFNLNPKQPQNSEVREKYTFSSVYIQVDKMSGPFKIRVFGVGGLNGTVNETNKADFYVISQPDKYQLYNKVHEQLHESVFLQFESDSNVSVSGRWSPDFAPDPAAVVLTGGPQPVSSIVSVSNPTKLIQVPYLNQQGIPTGCESVSAVMVLQWAGIDISPFEFITYHLVMRPVWTHPDPNCAFVGNPYSRHAFGCFAPCICRALQSVLESQKKDYQILNLTGAPFSQLITQYIAKNIPVLVWATMGMRPTKMGSTKWKIQFVNGDAKYKPGDTFLWPGNEHCLVLIGYTKSHYIFNDPLAGVGMYPMDVVESRYQEQGHQE